MRLGFIVTAPPILIPSPPQRRDETPYKLIFETDNLAAAQVQLAGHGAVVGEPSGGGACEGLDPEVNVFQLAKSRS
jgi:hypothetical protein